METKTFSSKLTLQKETIVKLRQQDSFAVRTRTRGNISGDGMVNFRADFPTALSADACTSTISGHVMN